MPKQRLDRKTVLLILATLAALGCIVWGALFLIAPIWQPGTPAAYQPVSVSAAQEPNAPEETALIDLNTADAAALQTLPGIGPAKAEAILADRETNGPYTNLQDVARVSGISKEMTEKWAGLATANAPEEKAP